MHLLLLPFLAIDFPCFPRRLPKIGLYRIGAMDFEIGRFPLRTAMISPKIRRKYTKGPDFILWNHCTLAISLPRNGMINYYKICRISGTFNWVWSSMEHFLYLNSCEIYSITAFDYFPLNKPSIVAISITVLYQLALILPHWRDKCCMAQGLVY